MPKLPTQKEKSSSNKSPSVARKTVGLALGSGGIRGLAHIGVLRSLIRHNIPIHSIAGTSIGAWVGGLYALTQDMHLLEDVTVGYQREKMRAMLELGIKGGFIRGKKMRLFLQNWFGDYTFADCAIPFSAIAADLITGKEAQFFDGPLVPAIQSSMAIPVLFAPIQYNNMLLVDGGIINPVPDDAVREMGADIVVAVNLDRYADIGVISAEQLTMRKAAARSHYILRHYLAQYSQSSADVLIEPRIELMGMKVWRQYFAKNNITQIIHAGEQEMEAHIPKLRALLGK